MRSAGHIAETLLCLANFPANTGFAWDFIERTFAAVADSLSDRGIRTVVAYPRSAEGPRALAGSAAEPIELDTTLRSPRSLLSVVRFVRAERVRVIYLVDRPAWSWAYAALRAAGVRHILVHDHTSGARTSPRGARRLLKRLVLRAPLLSADRIVAVSEFVRRRHIEAGLVPADRVVRVYNSVATPPDAEARPGALRAMIGAAPQRPLVVCTCRATEEKGVHVLLRAFDRVARAAWPAGCRPMLVYIGDGPAIDHLRQLRDRLASRDDIVLTGYLAASARYAVDAAFCVVPSLWQEAFGLAVIEPMAYGKTVIGTRVGAIPELIDHDVTGLLVPPADEEALAHAITQLLRTPDRAAQLGAAARRRVVQEHDTDRYHQRIEALIGDGFVR